MPLPGTAIFELLNKDYNCQFPDSLEKWGRWGAPLKLKLIKWFPKKIARRFYNIAKLSSAGVFLDTLDHITNTRIIFILWDIHIMQDFFSYLASKLQNWRYKNKYFKFAYEAILFAKLIRVYKGARNFFINEILKNIFQEIYIKR